ncbi:MAG: YbaB/EbfC family nucleoid-associated protein [Candidatus Saccharibacteria bacterium]|nr:YbaB/EbfC family nucleoid-associated protein [Candidatus Saccharibacteria bacterium]
MGQVADQMKMINALRKAQKELKNEIVEVEAGDGAVVVQINGELKVKSVKIDPERVDLDDIEELEGWIKNCFADGYAKAQEIATEKMKPMMSDLGGLMGGMGA